LSQLLLVLVLLVPVLKVLLLELLLPVLKVLRLLLPPLLLHHKPFR
jgi:hypothetical protein